MNLTLVLTGLATLGSIGAYGWCEQTQNECTTDECRQDGMVVSLGLGRGQQHTEPSPRDDGDERERGDASLQVDVGRLLP